MKEKHFGDCIHWHNLRGCEMKEGLGFSEEEMMQCELSIFGECDSYQE